MDTKETAMLDEMKETIEEIANNDGLWNAIAKCLRAQHDAMVRAGFTPEQAMEYLKVQGLAVSPT